LDSYSNRISSSIYFHNPKKVRADEWMFAEMSSPWTGDGRGVVTQKVFSKDGTLLATCFQEVSSHGSVGTLFLGDLELTSWPRVLFDLKIRMTWGVLSYSQGFSVRRGTPSAYRLRNQVINGAMGVMGRI
jgi:hypothetical protein